VLGRGGEHPLERLTVAGLELGALGESVAGTGDPRGKRIAHPLQLLEVGDSRLAKLRANSGVDAKPGEPLDAEAGELVLEAPDLAAQLSACEALVASHLMRGEHVPIEQIRHRPVIECNRPVLSRKRCAG
jgi:hypothetical protein